MDDDSQTSPAPATAKKSHLLRHILTGFFAIAPLYVTWWVFQFMFGLLANAGKPLVSAAASLIEPISATACVSPATRGWMHATCNCRR